MTLVPQCFLEVWGSAWRGGQLVGEEEEAHIASLAPSTQMPLVPGFQQTIPTLMLIPNPVKAKVTLELFQGEQNLLNGTFNLLLPLPSKMYKWIGKEEGWGQNVCMQVAP